MFAGAGQGEGVLKLIDFGFSKHFHEGKMMKSHKGTLSFMAPEVLQHQYTFKCDIWSLGVVVFRMLLGYLPFQDQMAADWDQLPPDAKDFVKSLLKVYALYRLFRSYGRAQPIPLDRGDKRKILSRKYDTDDTSEANKICIRRQEAVRKEVVATNFMWDTALVMAGLTWWSFRRYNYQSRLVALPFIFYGGTFIGRAIGDMVTGRNAEFARDRFLASLPAKVYYN
eukprot:s2466_g1.t1